MTFGELAVKDKFQSSAIPGVRFRKAPNGTGECVEDPNLSQFFHDAAPVTVLGKTDEDKPASAPKAEPKVEPKAAVPAAK